MSVGSVNGKRDEVANGQEVIAEVCYLLLTIAAEVYFPDYWQNVVAVEEQVNESGSSTRQRCLFPD